MESIEITFKFCCRRCGSSYSYAELSIVGESVAPKYVLPEGWFTVDEVLLCNKHTIKVVDDDDSEVNLVSLKTGRVNDPAIVSKKD